jgi:hypothetical protein
MEYQGRFGPGPSVPMAAANGGDKPGNHHTTCPTDTIRVTKGEKYGDGMAAYRRVASSMREK